MYKREKDEQLDLLSCLQAKAWARARDRRRRRTTRRAEAITRSNAWRRPRQALRPRTFEPRLRRWRSARRARVRADVSRDDATTSRSTLAYICAAERKNWNKRQRGKHANAKETSSAARNACCDDRLCRMQPAINTRPTTIKKKTIVFFTSSLMLSSDTTNQAATWAKHLSCFSLFLFSTNRHTWNMSNCGSDRKRRAVFVDVDRSTFSPPRHQRIWMDHLPSWIARAFAHAWCHWVISPCHGFFGEACDMRAWFAYQHHRPLRIWLPRWPWTSLREGRQAAAGAWFSWSENIAVASERTTSRESDLWTSFSSGLECRFDSWSESAWSHLSRSSWTHRSALVPLLIFPVWARKVRPIDLLSWILEAIEGALLLKRCWFYLSGVRILLVSVTTWWDRMFARAV